MIRAIRAVRPDTVYVTSYPAESVQIMRAIGKIGVEASVKIFGSGMIGLQYQFLGAIPRLGKHDHSTSGRKRRTWPIVGSRWKSTYGRPFDPKQPRLPGSQGYACWQTNSQPKGDALLTTSVRTLATLFDNRPTTRGGRERSVARAPAGSRGALPPAGRRNPEPARQSRAGDGLDERHRSQLRSKEASDD
jgi:hypothetical protein